MEKEKDIRKLRSLTSEKQEFHERGQKNEVEHYSSNYSRTVPGSKRHALLWKGPTKRPAQQAYEDPRESTSSQNVRTPGAAEGP